MNARRREGGSFLLGKEKDKKFLPGGKKGDARERAPFCDDFHSIHTMSLMDRGGMREAGLVATREMIHKFIGANHSLKKLSDPGLIKSEGYRGITHLWSNFTVQQLPCTVKHWFPRRMFCCLLRPFCVDPRVSSRKWIGRDRTCWMAGWLLKRLLGTYSLPRARR